MRTIDISSSEMNRRVARFEALEPMESQKNTDIPIEAADIVWSRKILSVIGLGEGIDTPINSAAPIKGAAGITVALAQCPPGTGPSLHAHRKTHETFTVMKGRFSIYWNDDGGEEVELGIYDTISVPPGVCRGFRNISNEEGILQVIISGGVHDMNDIDFAPQCAEEIERIQPGLLKFFEETGLTFTASKDAPK